MSKIKIGFIFGGVSPEHSISLRSAKSILPILKETYEVLSIAITHEGKWVVDIDPYAFESHSDQCKNQHTNGRANTGIVECLAEINAVDIFFPMLHGPFGEDGSIQGFFETLGKPYVGSSISASAIGMDKFLFKNLMLANHIPVVAFEMISKDDWIMDPAAIVNRLSTAFSYPLIVKPTNMGSSIGVTKVHNQDDLSWGIEQAFQFNNRILIEESVNAKEIEIAIVGNGNSDLFVSIPGQVSHTSDFYDFTTKYTGAPKRILPAPISIEWEQRIKNFAQDVYKSIGATGFARVDLFLTQEGRMYINEINTIPGLTEHGMFASLCDFSGLDFRNLLHRLIQLGFEKHQLLLSNRKGGLSHAPARTDTSDSQCNRVSSQSKQDSLNENYLYESQHNTSQVHI